MGERLNEGFSFSAYCAFASGATQALFGMRGRSYIVHSAIIVLLVPDSLLGAQQSRINCRVRILAHSASYNILRQKVSYSNI